MIVRLPPGPFGALFPYYFLMRGPVDFGHRSPPKGTLSMFTGPRIVDQNGSPRKIGGV